MNKIYILQKDIPNAKAGAEFKPVLSGPNEYIWVLPSNVAPLFYTAKYTKEEVENTEWFLPKKEAQPIDTFQWDNKTFKEFEAYLDYNKQTPFHVCVEEFKKLKSAPKEKKVVVEKLDKATASGMGYYFSLSADISRDKYDAIRKAIENALNQI